MDRDSQDFAPANPTDGRTLLEWEGKYTSPIARRWILIEAVYLAILLFATPVLLMALWLEQPKHWLSLSDEKYRPVAMYGFAWLSGMFGGTLFDIKWLYHSVAKQQWHLDRRLWRFFTPHISGGLAFIVVALISSGMLRVFDRRAIESPSLVVGLAALVGYFSDNTVAKLAEVANTLFGASRTHETRGSEDGPSAQK
jgi:hypothetical protein